MSVLFQFNKSEILQKIEIKIKKKAIIKKLLTPAAAKMEISGNFVEGGKVENFFLMVMITWQKRNSNNPRSPRYILLEWYFKFYWNDISNFTGMVRSWKRTPEFLFFNLQIKITGMTPEFSQENIWIICIRDKNLLQDHSSNIHTSTSNAFARAWWSGWGDSSDSSGLRVHSVAARRQALTKNLRNVENSKNPKISKFQKIF